MINVDIKALLNRLNSLCLKALEGAAGLCVARGHYEVAVEHFIIKLLEEPMCDFVLILKQFDIEPARMKKAVEAALEEFKTGNMGKPVFSPVLLEWFQEGWLISSVDLMENRIRSGALLMAMISRPGEFALGTYADLLRAIGRDSLKEQFWNIVASSVEESAREATAEGEAAAGPPGEESALAKYCEDFTAKAREGKIDPVFGRDREIRQMVDILARRRKNNPMVVGEAGVGKTAVVEGLALRIVEGDVPKVLQDVSILGLDMGLLQAGAGMKGEFENRLKSVINEIKASPKPIILFIDEAHTLIGAGGQAGTSDAANLLKPALARGELRTIAATTWSEYKKYFEKDAALARRFQLVKLDEPSVETTVLILRGLKPKYEEAHDVLVRDDAIEAAAELSSRYISGRQLPDKAVDLLDTSCARIKINLSSKPDVIEDLERKIQALEREKRALERDRLQGLDVDEERLSELEADLQKMNGELSALKERWLKEQELANRVLELRKELTGKKGRQDAPSADEGGKAKGEAKTDEAAPSEEAMAEEAEEAEPRSPDEIKAELEQVRKELEAIQGDNALVRTDVDPDVVAKVVSDWTGIPLGRVLKDEAQTIVRLEENLKKRVKGQDQAIEVISQTIKAAKAGLTDPSQPMGVFLLVGPSGTGKTETGLAVADLLFGGERFMVTINMSEFQERHTVSRLIGSPPGYVGYGEGGVLTEAVRQRPYSVVLLDEVEKADLEVMNLFYQVFDKGMLSDGEGRQIDFKNTVIFLTSNLASDVITELCREERPPYDTLVSAIRPILSNHFRPALLARMTIVPYYTLGPDALREIVKLKLDKLVRRLQESHKIAFTYSDEVVEQITARCTEVETGARNIDHILRGTVLPQMSREILIHMSTGAMPSKVHLGLAEDGNFQVSFQE